MEETMNIYSKNGDKVKVTKGTARNGYTSDQEHVATFLEIDKVYTVESTIVSGFNTSVLLVEFPNQMFNSVNFVDA